MRDYAKVSPQFWIGQTGKKLRQSGMEAQIVAMYLMTSPHANMLGLFYCPEMFIAHETGLGIEGACKGLQRCQEAGFCEYDKASEVVWVFEMATYQIADELTGKDLRIKGVQNEYDALPENPYLARFFEKYSGAFKMTSCRGITAETQSPFKAPSKPLASQEQEQEQEQEQGKPSAPAAPIADPSPEKRKPAVQFKTFFAECKAKGEKPIPENDTVFDWAEKAGIPDDFLRLAWLEFRDRYSDSTKRYRDWRTVFRNAVRDNWYGIWFCDDSGQMVLTSKGRTIQQTMREAA